MIEGCLHIERGVPTIKVLRSALCIRLKEAKNLHDGILDAGGGMNVRCTFEQFGALMAHSASVENARCVWFSDVQIIEPFNGLDITGM